jgi:hypothetical protein
MHTNFRDDKSEKDVCALESIKFSMSGMVHKKEKKRRNEGFGEINK